MQTFPDKSCVICGASWTPRTRYQATRNTRCSIKCSRVAQAQTMRAKPRKPPEALARTFAACAVCGVQMWRNTKHLKRVANPVCSYQCNGVLRGQEWAKHGHKGSAAVRNRASVAMEKNPAWKGGVTYSRRQGNYAGVRYVRAPEWALPMARADGYVMEHRLIVAAMCDFLLMRTEVVNHRDRKSLNNTPSNLELWPTNADHKRGEVGRFVPGVANRWSPMGLGQRSSRPTNQSASLASLSLSPV
jgi:hypothetical protein